ncbi:MAG: hypothetical protein WC847_01410 [Candidatus Paceibacterota bacterium]|jgi:hypothetical protein
MNEKIKGPPAPPRRKPIKGGKLEDYLEDEDDGSIAPTEPTQPEGSNTPTEPAPIDISDNPTEPIPIMLKSTQRITKLNSPKKPDSPKKDRHKIATEIFGQPSSGDDNLEVMMAKWKEERKGKSPAKTNASKKTQKIDLSSPPKKLEPREGVAHTIAKLEKSIKLLKEQRREIEEDYTLPTNEKEQKLDKLEGQLEDYSLELEEQKRLAEGSILKSPAANIGTQEQVINEIAELLKNNRINQVVIHGQKKIIEQDRIKNEVLTFDSDLDARTALFLLNEYNKKSLEETYEKDAVTSLVPKGGSEKNLTEKKKGLKIFIDVGGNWLSIEKDNETTTIHIDHHGTGKREPTSATKMMYEIMGKADLLKENPEWLSRFVNFVNEVDNLTYLEKKDKEGKKIFNQKYFEEKWPYTFYALAGKMQPDVLLELYKSGKIEDLSAPLTEEQLKGEIGAIKTKDNISIAKACTEQAKTVEATILGIKNAIKYAKEQKLNLNSTSLGSVVYHNFPRIKTAKGGQKFNLIPNYLGFIGTKALGFDTYVCWNEKKKEFFINSTNPNLSSVVEELNKAAPGSAIDVRGVMVFGKNKENLTEEQFLNTVDPNIQKKGNPVTVEPKQQIQTGPETKIFPSVLVEKITELIFNSKEVRNILGKVTNVDRKNTKNYLQLLITGENSITISLSLKSNNGSLVVGFSFKNHNFKKQDIPKIRSILTPEINKIPGLIISEIEKEHRKISKIEIIKGELKVTFVTPEPTSTQTLNPDTTPTPHTEAWTNEDEAVLAQLLITIKENKKIIETAIERLKELEKENNSDNNSTERTKLREKAIELVLEKGKTRINMSIGNDGFISLGDNPNRDLVRNIGNWEEKANEYIFIKPHETSKSKDQEPTTIIEYRITNKKDWLDNVGRGGQHLFMEIILPESDAKEIEKLLDSDPAAIREIFSEIMKRKILKNPEEFEKPQSKVFPELSQIKPPYKRWDNNGDEKSGKIYIQKGKAVEFDPKSFVKIN